MRLESVHALKAELLEFAQLSRTDSHLSENMAIDPAMRIPSAHIRAAVAPLSAHEGDDETVALGVARRGSQHTLAVRLRRQTVETEAFLAHVRARVPDRELDLRVVGDVRSLARRATSVLNRPRIAALMRMQVRPLLIGLSVGHPDVTAGTLGAFVVGADGSPGILSNNHVLANENDAQIGDAILQPGAQDFGRRRHAVANLSAFVPLKFRGKNMMDAATAKVLPTVAFEPSKLRGFPREVGRRLRGTSARNADLGDIVYKVGRTTGPRRGRVTAIELDNVVVGYGRQRTCLFDTQIEIEGDGALPFCEGGDSGSVIINRSAKAVALLFAGSDTGGGNGRGLTYATGIDIVLSELNVVLLA